MAYELHEVGKERWGGGEYIDADDTPPAPLGWETELGSRCEATYRIELHGVPVPGARRGAGGGAEVVARGCSHTWHCREAQAQSSDLMLSDWSGLTSRGAHIYVALPILGLRRLPLLKRLALSRSDCRLLTSRVPTSTSELYRRGQRTCAGVLERETIGTRGDLFMPSAALAPLHVTSRGILAMGLVCEGTGRGYKE